MGYVLQKKECECIGAMRAIDGYKTVAILHDELMVENVGGIEGLLRVMNEAVAAVVPGIVCEINEPELSLWFVPEKLGWFEKLQVYNPIDIANHREGLETWLPTNDKETMQDEGDSEDDENQSSGGSGSRLSPPG